MTRFLTWYGPQMMRVGQHALDRFARRAATVVLALTCAPLAAWAQVSEPWWSGFGGDAQHTAIAGVGSQPLARIRWQTRVDLRPQYTPHGSLPIHYGSPVVTQANTVVVPVKVKASSGFRVLGLDGATGARLWQQSSDYKLPPHDWVLPFSPTLSPTGKLWFPGAGGTLYFRTSIDVRGPSRRQQAAFYGIDTYRHDRRGYKTQVFVNTPITAAADGTVFFGFQVTGPTTANLESGIARLADDGTGSWVAAATAAGDPTIRKVVHNSAPALSNDDSTLYVAVTTGDGTAAGLGFLLALDSHTLATVASRRLKDPSSGFDAALHDDGTASPTVGPDGDVYFGVLENPFLSNHARGWLLHFNGALQPDGAPGAFGWDDTISLVPATMVPTYGGASTYLLMAKYNNYAEAGGDGVNRLALLDPNDHMIDPVSGVTVMREVQTVAGPTPDPDLAASFPGAVREWCINTAAVDPTTGSILAGNEDGKLYRWSLASGTLSESIILSPGLGEAYTPTLVGPDGTAYAINNATLFAVGQ